MKVLLKEGVLQSLTCQVSAMGGGLLCIHTHYPTELFAIIRYLFSFLKKKPGIVTKK